MLHVSCWALPGSCSSTAHAPRGGVRWQNSAAHAGPLRGSARVPRRYPVLVSTPAGTARVLKCLSAQGSGPLRAVLSCAGAYVSGAAGSNECPAGSVRIETEAACRTAVAAAGKVFQFVRTSSTAPRGCYHSSSSSNAFFNTHVVGAGIATSQLLCAAITTGALLTRRRRTDARRACRHRAGAARHSRAVCIIHGAHIDAHTYTNRHIYTHIYTRMMPTALAGGAARRTAAQADGGRACTGT